MGWLLEMGGGDVDSIGKEAMDTAEPSGFCL